MRPFIVAAIAIVILGGVNWFLASYESPDGGDRPGMQLIQASGHYSVELTLTFDVGPDEFGLEESGEAPSLLVQLNGKELLRRTDTIAASDSPIVLETVQEVVVGENEFYVQASPSGVGDIKPRCIRVRVLQDGSVVASESIWPELGDIAQGTLKLEVTSSE